VATVDSCAWPLVPIYWKINRMGGFDEKGAETKQDVGKTVNEYESGDEQGTSLSRHMSESSVAMTEDEDDDVDRKIDLGPQCTLKEQLEKDKVLFSNSHPFIYKYILNLIFFLSFLFIYIIYVYVCIYNSCFVFEALG